MLFHLQKANESAESDLIATAAEAEEFPKFSSEERNLTFTHLVGDHGEIFVERMKELAQTLRDVRYGEHCEMLEKASRREGADIFIVETSDALIGVDDQDAFFFEVESLFRDLVDKEDELKRSLNAADKKLNGNNI